MEPDSTHLERQWESSGRGSDTFVAISNDLLKQRKITLP